MSKFTTQIRWVVEQAEINETGSYSPGVYTQASYTKLGLIDYPIFEDNYREHLNNKIINHFYFREIGFETIGQFAWYMRRTMNEIMVYYNQLYLSEIAAESIEPLSEIDVTYTDQFSETRDGQSTSNTKTTGETTNDDSSIYSDTPMGMIEDGSTTLKEGVYATNSTFDQGTTNTETNSDTDSTSKIDTGSERTKTEKGYRISQSELLLKYRETFLNIDASIMEELETLFMGVW